MKPLTFADLKPNEAQMARINQLAPGGVDADKLAVMPMLVLDGAVTTKFTKHTPHWFAQAVRDINGDEGVSMQLVHDTQKLPTGRLFAGELGENANGPALKAVAFTDSAELVEKYLRGTVKAVSAGVCGDTWTCSICGNEIWSNECFKAAQKADHGWHCPGEQYDGKLCYVEVDVKDGNKALREVSPVYCGASNGKLLAPAEIAQMSSYADGKKKPGKAELEAMRGKLLDYMSQLAVDLPGAPPEADLSDPSDPSDELRAQLSATQAELATALAAADHARNDANAKCAAANDENARLKAELAAAAAALASANAASAELLAKLDVAAISAALKQDAKPDDKLAALAGLATLAVGLRTWCATRVEKMRVQAHGNDAKAPTDILSAAEAGTIVALLDAAEQDVCSRHGVPPLTGPAGGRQNRAGAPALPASMFQLR